MLTGSGWEITASDSFFNGQHIEFIRFLYRKDIYIYFPD